MPVDVRTEVEIDRARGEVAAYASDPDNATTWYENIEAVEWKSPQPLAVGSRMWGQPSGFSRVAAPMLAGAMRRANRKDLERLKAVLEAPE